MFDNLNNLWEIAFPRQTLEGIWLTIKGSTLKGALVSVVHGAYRMLLAKCFELFGRSATQVISREIASR